MAVFNRIVTTATVGLELAATAGNSVLGIGWKAKDAEFTFAIVRRLQLILVRLLLMLWHVYKTVQHVAYWLISRGSLYTRTRY